MQESNKPSDSKMSMKFEMDGEDSLSGTGNINDNQVISINSGEANFFTMKIELEKHMRQCDKVERISNCIQNFYDTEYGEEEKFLAKADEQIMKYSGRKELFQRTGCQLPCKQTKYLVEEFRRFNVKHLLDPEIQNFLRKNGNDSNVSIVVFSHHKSQIIIQNEEVLEYDTSRIISEIGGIVGIFIGLSFWSFYLDFIAPILGAMKGKFSG